MLNPIASEAIFSATYVDNYIDSVENLPDDVQRQLSRIRDIDVQYRSYLRDVDHYYDLWKTLQNSGDTSANRRTRAIARMQQSLIQAQELGDEKMQIVNQLQELIDHKTRQLDSDQKNLDIKEEDQQQQDDMQCAAATPQKVPRTQSPSRERSASVNGIVCETDASNGNFTKEQPYAINISGASNCITPTVITADRTSGDNGACINTQLNLARAPVHANALGVGNNNQILNVVVASSEPQRSVSKRSRRRNDTVNQNQLELGVNESNSNNETGSGSGDKNALSNSVSTQKPTSTGIGGGSGLAQKKNSIHGHGHGQSGSGASVSVGGGAAVAANSTSMGGGAGSGSGASTNSGKKKKRKARGAQATNAQNTREDTPPLDPIDPDEPTYCLCDQISFGEMILCDNDLCPIEWFHFSCVSLVLKPKGKWYCPNCRGDRPNVMKPKAQFLKELERYNKEKEEKT